MIGVTLLGGTGLYLGILGCWCVPDSHVLFSRYDKRRDSTVWTRRKSEDWSKPVRVLSEA